MLRTFTVCFAFIWTKREQMRLLMHWCTKMLMLLSCNWTSLCIGMPWVSFLKWDEKIKPVMIAMSTEFFTLLTLFFLFSLSRKIDILVVLQRNKNNDFSCLIYFESSVRANTHKEMRSQLFFLAFLLCLISVVVVDIVVILLVGCLAWHSRAFIKKWRLATESWTVAKTYSKYISTSNSILQAYSY